MARLATPAENAAVNAVTALAAYFALNSADPSTTGANEISGGSYARVAITWGTASSGSAANSASLTSNVPASTTVAYFSTWSAITSGTNEMNGALSSSQTFSTAGTLTVAIGALTAACS